MDLMHGDRPIVDSEQDRLGFRPLAERIAHSIMNQASDSGFVIGIEGNWGSGKSSLLQLVLAALRAVEEKPPGIVEFRPWLVGDRDALLFSLFGELTGELEKIALAAGDPTSTTREQAKEAARLMRAFGRRVGTVGKLVSAAAIAVPGLNLVGGIMEKIGEAAADDPAEPSLASLKARLADALRETGRRIVVTIDDVDRLEPAEVIEVLRLVRSVADFPNVVYLLCYDERILAASITAAAKVDGAEFLEKIVRMSLSVPDPESYVLGRWFQHELNEFAGAIEPHIRNEVEFVVWHEGARRLHTPRNVVKALNAVRFYWPSLRDRIDLSDLVWLQLVRSNSPALYRWIEDYCTHFATAASGRAVPDGVRNAMAARLAPLLGSDPKQANEILQSLCARLPGMSARLDELPTGDLFFQSVLPDQLERSRRTFRLYSPDHYRLYFAFTPPLNLPELTEVDRFLDALRGMSTEAAVLLAQWSEEKLGEEISKAEVALHKLVPQVHGLNDDQCHNLVRILGEVMDKAAIDQDPGYAPPIWRLGKDLLSGLRIRLPPEDGRSATLRLFRDGPSLRWLTFLFSDELYGHNLPGEGPRYDVVLLLAPDELAAVTTVMLDRYRMLQFDNAVKAPGFGWMMHAWKQCDREGAAEFVRRHIAEDDSRLLDFLAALVVKGTGSDGEFSMIMARDLDGFLLDYEAENRMAAMLNAPSVPGGVHSRIGELRSALETGRSYK